MTGKVISSGYILVYKDSEEPVEFVDTRERWYSPFYWSEKQAREVAREYFDETGIEVRVIPAKIVPK